MRATDRSFARRQVDRGERIVSQEERYGTRSREYSAWHRRNSARRFVGLEKAQLMAMVDIDACAWVEMDDATKEPLALIETALDVGQAHKADTATARLAQRANLPCYCVLYTCSSSPNPADPTCKDILRFRVRRSWPAPESGWRTITPLEWAHALLQIRAWAAERVGAAAANDTAWEKAPRQEQLFDEHRA